MGSIIIRTTSSSSYSSSYSHKRIVGMQHKAALILLLALASVFVAASYGFVETAVGVGVGVDAFPIRTNQQLVRPTAAMAVARRGDSRKRNLFRLFDKTKTTNGEEDDSSLDEKENYNSTPPRSNNPLTNMMVVAAFVTSTLDPNGSMVAKAEAAKPVDLDIISQGTPTIETKTLSGDSSKISQMTETTVKNLAQKTVFDTKNRNALTASVKRIQSTIQKELTSVEAWKEVTKILSDYGVDLKKETTVSIRPPSDWKATFDEFKTSKRLNVLVNGEIVQIQLEYNKGTNTKKAVVEEGKPVQPDDELVLRIKGYKGFDPNAPIRAVDGDNNNRKARTRTPPGWYSFWKTPIANKNVATIAKTNGDVIVIGGSTAIAASYAISYAYYVDLNEKEAAATKKKAEERAAAAKAKKEAAAATQKAKTKPDDTEVVPKKKGGGWRQNKKKKEPPKPKAKKQPPKPKEEDKQPKEKKQQEDKVKPPPVVESKKESTKKKKTKEKKTNPIPPTTAPAPPLLTPMELPPVTTKQPPAAAPAVTTTAKETNSPPAPAPLLTPMELPPVTLANKDVGNDTSSSNDGKDDDGDDVKVVIDFDDDGRVVITASGATSGVNIKLLPLIQALYFPWLGFFVSSSKSTDDRSNKSIRFFQALYLPWAGIFFPTESTTTKLTTTIAQPPSSATSSEENTANKKTSAFSIYPFVRALWFPWVGFFERKKK